MAQQRRGRRLRKRDLPRDPLGRLRPPGAPDALGYLKTLERDVRSADEALERAFALFDQERFFESLQHFQVARHRDAEGAEFWRTLAQVAAGLCHVQRRNHAGAVKVLERARGRLTRRPASRRGIQPAPLAAAVDEVLLTIRRHGLDAVRFPRLPRQR